MWGATVIVSVARPGLTSTIFMPRPRLASSSFHIASAQARATSSGDNVALTFTSGLPDVGLVETSLLNGLLVVGPRHKVSTIPEASNVIVIDHDLVRNRLGLTGENKTRLQLPRLQRIVHIHLGLAFDQLGAAASICPLPARAA